MASLTASPTAFVTPKPTPPTAAAATPPPTSPPAPIPTAGPAPVTGDSVSVSKESQTTPAKAQNPYAAIADNSTSVAVDPWKKGKNDTLEGMLRNQGYSLQDIYNKDKKGKTLIDHVAKANKLKNPNLIRDGAKLNIPSRANSESMSSMDLKKGETQSSEVSNNKADITTKSQMDKNQDGSTDLGVQVDNGKNRDANLGTKTSVPDGGRIDTSSTAVKSGVETNTVAMNKDGSAVTQEKTQASSDKTETTIKDIDRKGDNLAVQANESNVSVTNAGSKKGGDVTTNVDISEGSSDGPVEDFGRGVAEFFTGAPAAQKPVSVPKTGQVDVTKNSNGQATVSTTDGGKRTERLKTAGDTDDSWVERAGEWTEETLTKSGNAFQGAWKWLTGQETPDAQTNRSGPHPR